MPLPATVIFAPESDTRIGLASRLAAANGFNSLTHFLSMCGIKPTALRYGEPAAVAILASWSGETEEALSHFQVTSYSRGLSTWHLGQATLNRRAWPGKCFRYCPRCIVEDLSTGHGLAKSRPRQRVLWSTSAVVNCIEHTCPIVEVKADHNETGDDLCSFVAANLERVQEEAARHAAPVSTELDEYIAGRIAGRNSDPFLDRFEACIVADLSTELGRFIERYPAVASLIDPTIGSSPREKGFALARQGAARLAEAVAMAVKSALPTRYEAFSYGSLGRWLRDNSKRPKYADIVEIFQDAGVRSLPYGPGARCFIPVRERFVHSAKTASVEYGLYDKRVAQLVIDAGLVDDPSLKTSQMFFDAKAAHPILAEAARTMTSKEVRDELGVAERTMTKLIDRKLLARVEQAQSGRIYTRIRADDFEAFKKKVFGDPVDTDVTGMIPIDQARLVCMCGLDTLLGAIVDGVFTRVSAPAGHNFKIQALHLDPEEVRTFSAATSYGSSEALTADEANRYLQVRKGTIPFLIEAGLLERRQQNPGPVRLVKKAALDEFVTNHISVKQLAEAHGTHSSVIRDYLEARGVTLIGGKCPNVTAFCRRSEVADIAIDLNAWRRDQAVVRTKV